ncbi:MAG: HD family phosphohydrolase [Chitinophagales bacterium]
MSNQWKGFSKKTQLVVQLGLAIASIIFIYWIFPKVNRFQYDYEQGKPWAYQDLYSPFDFSVLKSVEAIEQEEQAINDAHLDHYLFQENREQEVQEKFSLLLEGRWEQLDSTEQADNDYAKLQRDGEKLISAIYEESIIDKAPNEDVVLMQGNTAHNVSAYQVKGINYAIEEIEDFYEGKDGSSISMPILKIIVDVNYLYDDSLNQQILAQKLAKISTTGGLVQKGQIVIEKGEVISDETYQKLLSFEKSYEEKVVGESQMRWLSVGYLILISIAIAVLILYLFFYKPKLFLNIRHYFFVLILINLALLATSTAVKLVPLYILFVPYCIIPIVLRSFFKRELALYVHLVIILIAGFFIPKSFHFVFIQVVAGIIAIYGNKDVRYWSQFFSAIGFILLAYLMSYIGFALITEGNLNAISLPIIGCLFANVVLTFLAYPLIPFFERIFGLISEISLAEYTDLNKPLLKKLSLEAPGTFQHSLQVANLAEAATAEIGGNSLLVKVGGLYHDVGKLERPVYFIENQSGLNPHSKIGYEQSAEIIIGHVTNGIKIAKKAGLPSVIVDFIRTHHGTTRVEYFYRLHTQEVPPEHIDEDKFVYPGPSPFTKEQAVLMMADSVEAASKSLQKPSYEQLEGLIDKIVDSQMSKKQFDNAPITFKEIKTCKKVFLKMLASIYHVRIAYPDEKK